MFDFVRKHTKIMMMLMFLLIIPSFILFGMDNYSQMGDTDEVVAVVGGTDITQSQWDRAHKSEVDRLRASQPNLDPKLLDSAEARYATLERLIREQVLSTSAKNTNLTTSDARLARFLQEDPGISALRKPDGKLDMDRYRQLAASQGMTPEGFEQTVRQDISKQQVELGVRTSGFATPAPADIALNAFFEKREIQVVNFQASDYVAKISPTDAELQAFYQSNQNLFQAPEQARIEYVVLDLETVKNSIQISEADLRSYFDQNVARLSGSEERRASHILLNAPKSAPQVDRQKAKETALDILRQVRAAPEKFADLAKLKSQDTGSAIKGGDLDFFPRGAMVKPFEEAVFSMKKGDISDVVESDFGFHIIKLADIKTPKQRSFDELRTTLENDLKTQQAQRKYAEVAEMFTNMVFEQSDSLKPVADKLKLEVKVADKLPRQAIPEAKGVLANEKFLSAVFSPETVEKKRNTEAIETAVNQLAAGHVVAHSPARILPLAEVGQQVRERVIVVRAAELARKEGNEKLALWKSQPDKAALPAAIVVSRDQAQGVTVPIINAALHADPSKLPAWLGVDSGAKGYSVIRVNKILPRPESAQATTKQDRGQYAQWWTSAESQAYFALLKERLNVQILVASPTKELLAAGKSAATTVTQSASQ